MARILFWLLVILAVQWLWRLTRRDDPRRARDARSGPSARHTADEPSGRNGADRAGRAAAGRTGPAALPEAMVRCAECGVHAPVSEMLTVDGQRFCCRDHAARYAARPVGRDAR